MTTATIPVAWHTDPVTGETHTEYDTVTLSPQQMQAFAVLLHASRKRQKAKEDEQYAIHTSQISIP